MFFPYLTDTKQNIIIWTFMNEGLYDFMFMSRTSWEAGTKRWPLLPCARYSSRGSPLSGYLQPWQGNLHSSTLSPPWWDARVCCTFRHKPCTKRAGCCYTSAAAERDGAIPSTWMWPHWGQEARRANKVDRTVTRYMEVCKYVKK